MEIMIHMKQKDRPLAASKYVGLALLLADAAAYYEKIGFAKFVGTALNPDMDTFVLVEAPSVQAITDLIDRIARVKEVRMFIEDGETVHDYIDLRIMPMVKGGNHAGGKGRTSVEAACNDLQQAIDSGLLSDGDLHDAQEAFARLNCETVLDPIGGGGGGGGFDGGISPGGGWPDPFGGI